MKPEESIGYLIRRTGRGLRNMVSHKLKEADVEVTMEQASIIMHLDEEEGVPQHDLVSCLDKDKTTITRVITNMEKNSLIVRVSSHTDKRVKLLYLTQKGKDLKQNLGKVLSGALKTAIEGIQPNEVEIAKKVLNQIFLNVNNYKDINDK